MNKTEAMKRLDAIEAEAKELRKIIDAPEGNVFVPGVGKRFFVPYFVGGWDPRADEWTYNTANIPVAYRTPEAAAAMAEAIQTMMLVQLHGGAESVGLKSFSICDNALENVGHDRILSALKTIVGVK